MSDSLWPHESQHTRPPCPSQASGVYSNSCPSRRWCHPIISSSVIPFSSCLQSFPASGLFTWVSSSHQVAKVLEFQAQHQSFQWIFRTDFLQDWLVWSPCSLRNSQESSQQFKSINCLVLSFLYSPTLKSIHDHWKNHSLTRWTFVGKVMSLLFNMLSSFSSKKQASFNFMAAVTISHDFGAQENSLSLFPLFYLFAVKWWDQKSWS